MVCTRCGHENRVDARFCDNCGSPLEPDATLSIAAIEADDQGLGDLSAQISRLTDGQALLLANSGPNAGSVFLLEPGEVTVGRSPESAVFLDDVTVSRRHATFSREGDHWLVRDVGSLNGTYVNGTRVDTAPLGSGDHVQIGRFKLTFVTAGG